jgi:hypothetical protein
MTFVSFCPFFDRLIVNILKLVIMKSKSVQQHVSTIKWTHHHFCARISLVEIVSFSVLVRRNDLHNHVILPR